MIYKKSTRARNLYGSNIGRNGMNSKAQDYGWTDPTTSPELRRFVKKEAGKAARRNAKTYCRQWLDS